MFDNRVVPWEHTSTVQVLKGPELTKTTFQGTIHYVQDVGLSH